MDILTTIVVGALAGYLASVIMRTDYEQGLVTDIVLGIIGAFVGGFVMNLLGQPGTSGFNLYSVLVATLGAALIIGIGRSVLYRY